jgi:hypothetical protein
MARTLLAAALAAAAAAQYNKCLERYQCIFHTDVGNNQGEYSWDLSGLCRQRGEYTVQLGGSGDQYIAFNICGNTTSMCSYNPLTPLYTS